MKVCEVMKDVVTDNRTFLVTRCEQRYLGCVIITYKSDKRKQENVKCC